VTDPLAPLRAFAPSSRGVWLPGQVAAWLERTTDLALKRSQVKGEPELWVPLAAIRLAAAEHNSGPTSVNGSNRAPSPEVGPDFEVQHLEVAVAAGLIGITDRAVRLACQQGRLPATRRGGRWQIRRADALNFKSERST